MRERRDAFHDDPVTAIAVGERMAALCVGGPFWGSPAAPCRVLLVLACSAVLPAGRLDGYAILPRSGVTARVLAEGRRRGAEILDSACDVWPAIHAAHAVFVDADDEVAVLALAAGKPTRALDGRDLTPDRAAILDRALLGGRCYRDPVGGGVADVMAVIERLAGWRRMIDANRGIGVATGMAWWKRDAIRRFLWDGRPGRLPLARPTRALALVADSGRRIAAWPSRVPQTLGKDAANAGNGMAWVEDGFIRSVGLGSDLVPPLSVTVDDLRPHFDPAGPSRLELMLAEDEFPADLLTRAAALRTWIVAAGIGKYAATGSAASEAVPRPAGRVVLVAGQVSNDLSVIRGGGAVKGNLDLLRRARAYEPDAYIIFRPHPDVVAGHRDGRVNPDDAMLYADRIDDGGSAGSLLLSVDAVHVLTSLIGFEALMRGREVVVHGQPFFAGWGLTRDLAPPIARRGRMLTLDMLVAATLIRYPRYLDPETGLPCSVEDFLATLGTVRRDAGWLVRFRQWQGRLNSLVRTF